MKMCTLVLLLTVPIAILLSGCATGPRGVTQGPSEASAAQGGDGSGVAMTSESESEGVPGDKSMFPPRKSLFGGIRGSQASAIPGTGVSQFSVWRSAGAIIFVLAGLLAVNGFIKKRQGICTGTGKTKNIRLVERLAIDPRRSILLVEVDGRRVLVGTAGDGLESLAVLGEARSSEQK